MQVTTLEHLNWIGSHNINKNLTRRKRIKNWLGGKVQRTRPEEKNGAEDPANKDAGKDALEDWNRLHHKHYKSPKLRCKSEGKVREAPTDKPSCAFLLPDVWSCVELLYEVWFLLENVTYMNGNLNRSGLLVFLYGNLIVWITELQAYAVWTGLSCRVWRTHTCWWTLLEDLLCEHFWTWPEMNFNAKVILNWKAVKMDVFENVNAVKNYATIENDSNDATSEMGKRKRKMATKGIMHLLDILQKTWKSKLTQANKIKQKVDKLLSLKITTETVWGWKSFKGLQQTVQWCCWNPFFINGNVNSWRWIQKTTNLVWTPK